MLVVRFMGGFANQLFQYAMYLNLIEHFPTEKVYADVSLFDVKDFHGGFKLGRLVSLNYYKDKNFKSFKKITEDNFNLEDVSSGVNYVFSGYWQDRKFFPSDLSGIYDIFKYLKLDDRNEAYLQEINNSFSVSVHVRRGDYIYDNNLSNVATPYFYQESIDYEIDNLSDVHFFVFSNDMEWCRHNLDFHGAPTTFVEGNSDDVVYDIFLMSKCKHNIISNSSFSWWSTFLNKNKEKKIIMPEYWFNTPHSNNLDFEDAVHLPNTPLVEEENDKPVFSFVVYSYNSGCYIRRCLSTVLNQTYQNIEIIIIDDGSTDDSISLINKYVERDKRIRFIKNGVKNGMRYAFNTGMKMSRGKYVLFSYYNGFYDLNACNIILDSDIIDKNIEFNCYDHKKICGKNSITSKCFNKDIVEKNNASGFSFLDRKLYYFSNNLSLSEVNHIQELELMDEIAGTHYFEEWGNEYNKNKSFVNSSFLSKIKQILLHRI